MLMLGRPRRVLSRRLVAAVSAAAFLSLVFAAHAGATLFSAGVSPGTASAGATATYQVTIRNLLGPPLGSANVQVPTGWTGATVGTPVVRKPNGTVQNRQWTAAIVGGVLQLRATGPGASNKLPLLWSLRVEVTATAPCTAGVSQWTSAARTGSNFDGLPFFLVGKQPKVTVSGTCNAAETTIPAEVGVPASGSTCENATTALTSCLFLSLPNGANGPVQLITHNEPFGDLPATDRPFETFQSVLGNFKDDEEQPIYDQFNPAFLDIEVDASLVDFCGEDERTIQGGPPPRASSRSCGRRSPRSRAAAGSRCRSATSGRAVTSSRTSTTTRTWSSRRASRRRSSRRTVTTCSRPSSSRIRATRPSNRRSGGGRSSGCPHSAQRHRLELDDLEAAEDGRALLAQPLGVGLPGSKPEGGQPVDGERELDVRAVLPPERDGLLER